jgi:hypothetical protein
MPRYSFTRSGDFKDFQREIHGKKLVAQFLCTQIGSGLGIKARDEFLKIWENRHYDQRFISFYASAPGHQGDREFQVTMFVRLDKSNSLIVILDFKIVKLTAYLAGPFGFHLTREASDRRQLNSIYEVSTAEGQVPVMNLELVSRISYPV